MTWRGLTLNAYCRQYCIKDRVMVVEAKLRISGPVDSQAFYYRTVYIMVCNCFSEQSLMGPDLNASKGHSFQTSSWLDFISRPTLRQVVLSLFLVLIPEQAGSKRTPHDCCGPMGYVWERRGTEAWDLLFHWLFSLSSISYSNTHTILRVDTWTDRPCSLSFSGFSFSFSLSTRFKSLHYLSWRSYTIQPRRERSGMRSWHKSIQTLAQIRHYRGETLFFIFH